MFTSCAVMGRIYVPPSFARSVSQRRRPRRYPKPRVTYEPPSVRGITFFAPPSLRLSRMGKLAILFSSLAFLTASQASLTRVLPSTPRPACKVLTTANKRKSELGRRSSSTKLGQNVFVTSASGVKTSNAMHFVCVAGTLLNPPSTLRGSGERCM